jgi:hypothetical protein
MQMRQREHADYHEKKIDRHKMAKSRLRRWVTYGLAELLEKSHGLALKTTGGEPAASARVDEIHQLLIAEVEEVLEVDAPEGELLEGSFPGVGLQVVVRDQRLAPSNPSARASLHERQIESAHYRHNEGTRTAADMADVDGREGRGKKEPKSPKPIFSHFRGPLLPG